MEVWGVADITPERLKSIQQPNPLQLKMKVLMKETISKEKMEKDTNFLSSHQCFDCVFYFSFCCCTILFFFQADSLVAC